MPQRIQNINGVLYVYEDRASWDKATKNAKHTRHYIGKMVNNVFVPNPKYLLERELEAVKKKEARPGSDYLEHSRILWSNLSL